MKRFFLLSLVFIGLSLHSFAQKNKKNDNMNTTPEPCLICVGSVLTYTITMGEEVNTFTLRIDKMGDEGITFTYTLGANGYGYSAQVVIGKEALAGSMKTVNYFGNENMFLDEQTTVWLSRAAFKSLRSGKQTTLWLDNDELNFAVSMDDNQPSMMDLDVLIARPISEKDKKFVIEDDQYTGRWESLRAINADANNGGNGGSQPTLSVLDNPDFPLIVYLYTGEFEVRLSSIL